MKKIWFDLENSPHAWILKDFIRAFEAQHFECIITARDFAQTFALCDYMGFHYEKIGQAAKSSSGIKKALSVVDRARLLWKYVNQERPVLCISHGSRSQALAAFALGIPVISLDDYEFSFKWFNKFVTRLYTPFPIPKNSWGINPQKVIHYPGLKEELYLWNSSDYAGVEIPEVIPEKINILFRPAGDFSHYQSEKSFELQERIIAEFSRLQNCNVILMARSNEQRERLKAVFSERKISFTIPGKVLNGPALIQKCDLMIGGGGTMTREACVLNTPSYSFFNGEMGAVDKYLVEQGKLVMLQEASEVDTIRFVKKASSAESPIRDEAFHFVLNSLNELLNRSLGTR